MTKSERENIVVIIEGLDTTSLQMLARDVSRLSGDLQRRGELSKDNAGAFECIAVQINANVVEMDKFIDYLELYTR